MHPAGSSSCNTENICKTQNGIAIRKCHFSLKSVFMVDVRFELTTSSSSSPSDGAIC